jgi:kynurenine formamidase
MSADLPSFAELPVQPGAPAGSSWGVWGPDDVLGCLNLLTGDAVRAGVACVEVGKVFSLNLDLTFVSPPLFGRPMVEHVVHSGPTGHDDELRSFNTQCSTQWDGFRHVRHPLYGYYNGIADADHGMDHWARRGIAGRAVLADVERWRASVGRSIQPGESDPIFAEDIAATLEAQEVTLATGDILLIRTGWLTWYRSLTPDQRTEMATTAVPDHTGIHRDISIMEYFWDAHVAAVAADNPGFEVMPVASVAEGGTRWDNPSAAAAAFLHSVLIPLLGLPIGELFDLDALAEDCEEDQSYRCLLTSAPLRIRGGVASPPNALAIK